MYQGDPRYDQNGYDYGGPSHLDPLTRLQKLNPFLFRVQFGIQTRRLIITTRIILLLRNLSCRLGGVPPSEGTLEYNVPGGARESYPAWSVEQGVPLSKEEIEDVFLDLTQKFGFQRDSMRNMVCPLRRH